MLGMAKAMEKDVELSFASFSETNRCHDFLRRAADMGFTAIQLQYDTPRLVRTYQELKKLLCERKVDVLVCQGYKADLIGWLAARRVHVPVVSVSRGWTDECRRVRLYEWLDRRVLREMDRVICVSRAQADKVRAVGVRPQRIEVIHNSMDTERFRNVVADDRDRLLDFFPVNVRPHLRRVIGSAGRLSPEKGFELLIEAARHVMEQRHDIGVVLFGDGPLRESLKKQAVSAGIEERFVFAGFCHELDRFIPHLDLFVQSSHSEGMPNVLLESLGAGVPVVATNVGGTNEVLIDGQHGRLVPAANVDALTKAILEIIGQPDFKSQMSKSAKQWIVDNFSFDAQAEAYRDVLLRLT
jgi:glycosyltransferase involved in cell wall biosynthesis